MIVTKKELIECLKTEKNLYIGGNWKNLLRLSLLKDHDYLLWKYAKSLRYTEYHFNNKHRIRYYIWQRKKNIIGSKLGVTMWHNTVDAGLRIWHYGSIIVNGHTNIGKNCQLHGDNCIGNKGESEKGVPTIGDNVDIGVGAKIIGGVYIASNIRIGANAVVTRSFYEEGITIVGVPAKKVQ
ncbi:serine O-acetyltransferase [Sporolactobacillus spathodeae]|uniref:Serine O-acetyltransferase n=1 Tax=Sporolactobacillus spathodeae TaxID=1465502 RepID=A0ABS2Q7I4_9BACL|nr:poly-gamma-glutamate biosynthesis protein [Sporolactobacillus spathodeae]MBM7657753.1 serine O-acetyltransferase [Sporolactobacillus spathodeae]